MRALAELSGNPYVNLYASEVKRELESTGRYPEGAEPGGHLEERREAE